MAIGFIGTILLACDTLHGRWFRKAFLWALGLPSTERHERLEEGEPMESTSVLFVLTLRKSAVTGGEPARGGYSVGLHVGI